MGKLFILQARDVHLAVIIRRGPSAWHHLISWNTKTDELDHGAWIKGRIYEDKCDISPDGKLLLYFVLKEQYNELGLPNTWTALSRPPWLKALALWPHGDTYSGGGRFIDNRTIVLRPISEGWGDVCHPDFPNSYVSVVQNHAAELHCTANIVPDSDWSGYDLSGRIIHTKGDKLFRINQAGVESEVADFCSLKPNPTPAPEWAGTFP